MAWRMTERAQAAMVRREWCCDICDHSWKTECSQSDSSIPECPLCHGVAPTVVFRPIAINRTAAKALDVAQRMVEEQYGMTDIRDHIQTGETAAMPPPPIQTAEAETITRELINAGVAQPELAPQLKQDVQRFFSPNGVDMASVIPRTPDAARAMVGGGAQMARSEGVDPMALLHQAGKKGLDPVKNLRVHGGS